MKSFYLVKTKLLFYFVGTGIKSEDPEIIDGNLYLQ